MMQLMLNVAAVVYVCCSYPLLSPVGIMLCYLDGCTCTYLSTTLSQGSGYILDSSRSEMILDH